MYLSYIGFPSSDAVFRPFSSSFCTLLPKYLITRASFHPFVTLTTHLNLHLFHISVYWSVSGVGFPSNVLSLIHLTLISAPPISNISYLVVSRPYILLLLTPTIHIFFHSLFSMPVRNPYIYLLMYLSRIGLSINDTILCFVFVQFQHPSVQNISYQGVSYQSVGKNLTLNFFHTPFSSLYLSYQSIHLLIHRSSIGFPSSVLHFIQYAK